ncbi:MAG TPA: DinB family protein [Anaerolineae bacterium]|nr:DinB family protein [Anaerolineae bacterium]
MPLPLNELVDHPELVNQRAQELDWEELLFEYELTVDDAQAWLRGLNEEQIHFTPAVKVYSIAEIVTHNSFADEMFWGWIDLLVQARSAEIDPATLIGGDGARNTATLSDLEALNEACRTLARHTIDSLPLKVDLAGTAPHPYFGELNAKGWIYFMALHRGMHRYQCEGVIDAPGFPRSASVQTLPREVYQPSERKTWLKEEKSKQQAARSKKKTVTATTRKQTATKKHTATAAQKKTANKKKTTTRSK